MEFGSSRRTVALLLALGLAWPAAAQVRDGRAVAAGSSRIAGTVMAASTGQPLPGATVRLTGTAIERSTRTDTLGQFAFNDLPAGDYTLAAGRNGFQDVVHGQAQPGSGRPGTPISLTDGQQRLDVELALPRGSAITGLVVDEFGYPAAETAVVAYRYSYRSGVRQLQRAGSGQTDDRGIYRVYALAPGDYVVAAMPRVEHDQVAHVTAEASARLDMVRQELELVRQRAAPAEREAIVNQLIAAEKQAAVLAAARPPARPVSGYAPVYYSGTTRASMAAALAVGVSEEKTGVDFVLEVVPMATIEGTVSGVSPLPKGLRIFLTEEDSVPGLGTRSTRAGADGRFAFSGVPPGQYRLSAQAAVAHVVSSGSITLTDLKDVRKDEAPADRYWARQPLTVNGQAQHISLALQPAMSASGRVEFRGAGTLPDVSRIRINFLPTDLSASEAEMEMGSTVGRVGPDGTFVADGLAPGRYRVSASGAGGAWSLYSVQVAGREVLDAMLDVVPGEDTGNLTVTFADRTGSLSGTLQLNEGTPTAGYTIIVFPEDRRFWMPHARRIQATRPATNGQFQLKGLPAGTYRLAAVVDPEPGIWFDPDYLGRLLPASIPLMLGDGEARVQDVRIEGR